MNKEIKIIYNDDSILILNKASGIPSAPLKSLEEFSALSYACEKFPEILNVKGKKEIEYGLIHRIDTLTSGLLLIAKNQIAYDFLINEQSLLRYIKKYTAKCNIINEKLQGFPIFSENLKKDILQNKEISVKSYFRSFGPKGAEVRPVSIDKAHNTPAANKKTGSTIYETKIQLNKIENNIAYVTCEIAKGFRHQVRCHLSWLGLPVIADPIYNPSKINNDIDVKNDIDAKMEFYASGLKFTHPKTLEYFEINI